MNWNNCEMNWNWCVMNWNWCDVWCVMWIFWNKQLWNELKLMCDAIFIQQTIVKWTETSSCRWRFIWNIFRLGPIAHTDFLGTQTHFGNPNPRAPQPRCWAFDWASRWINQSSNQMHKHLLLAERLVVTEYWFVPKGLIAVRFVCPIDSRSLHFFLCYRSADRPFFWFLGLSVDHLLLLFDSRFDVV